MYPLRASSFRVEPGSQEFRFIIQAMRSTTLTHKTLGISGWRNRNGRTPGELVAIILEVNCSITGKL
jgi:hypothetical protein